MSLFVPDDPWNTSRLFRFLHEVNEKHGLELGSYEDLYQWSISNTDLFWSDVWDHTRIIGNKGKHVVDTTATPAENPIWFSDSVVNFAENLLSNRSPDTMAIVQVGALSSDVWSKSLAMSFACSGANFPESQARTRPNLQCGALLPRGRRSVGSPRVWACPGRPHCIIHIQPHCELTPPVPDLIPPGLIHWAQLLPHSNNHSFPLRETVMQSNH